MKAVIVTYVVKKGHEAEFEKILRRHWKALRGENLTTQQDPFLLKDPESPTVYKEIFEWRSQNSFQKAQESQQVLKIWKKMMELTEEGGIEPAYFKRI
jgi:heme-degrading monooxygenase HmoA